MAAFFGVVVASAVEELRQCDDEVGSYVNASWPYWCHVCGEVIINHRCRAKDEGTPTDGNETQCVEPIGHFSVENGQCEKGFI